MAVKCWDSACMQLNIFSPCAVCWTNYIQNVILDSREGGDICWAGSKELHYFHRVIGQQSPIQSFVKIGWDILALKDGRDIHVRRRFIDFFLKIKKCLYAKHNSLIIIQNQLHVSAYIYTGCPRRNVPDFGRVFLMLKYTDITPNTYVQSWTVTKIMARGKCGLLAGPRTVPVSWQVLSMFVLECGVWFSSH